MAMASSCKPQALSLWLTRWCVQPDGKIVAVGYVRDGTRNIFVLRLLADGTPDPDFAGGGLIRTFVGGESEAYDVVLQPDDKILVAGVAGNDFLLVRYLPNGELDPAFEGDAVTLVQFSAGRDQAYALALQADGKIIAAGHSFVAGENRNRFAVARLLPDGLPDLTFAGSGKVIVPVAGESDSVRALALQNDGKIVLAGLCFRNVAPGNDFAAVRLHADGTVDTSFAQAGKRFLI